MSELIEVSKLHDIVFVPTTHCPEIQAMQSKCRLDFSKPIKHTDYTDLFRTVKFCKGELP